MAKKTAKRVEKKRISFVKTGQPVLPMRLTDSYISLLLGIIVVILVVAGGVWIAKMRAPKMLQQISSTSTMREEGKANKTTYTIKEGESLSMIAEKFYGDGEKWQILAKENNIISVDTIESGTTITVPLQQGNKEVVEATNKQKIEDTTYTVVEGDFLWDIALRAYGDGYRWVDIATANGLQTPDDIASGMTLRIPR